MKAIVVRYLGPTNTRGSRYKASAEGVKSLTIPTSYRHNDFDNERVAAEALCLKYGWKGELTAGTLPGGDTVFVFSE